ncbi:MAG: mechanosensitive ion channel [Chloroflexi bacterium]|nr:mechanosensitive ion channel [Chloroflexota bacterium]
MDVTSPLDSLQLELNTILVLLERPIVQQQMLDLLLLTVGSWFLALLVHRWGIRYLDKIRGRYHQTHPIRFQQIYSFFVLLDLLTFAIVALLLLQLNIALFERSGLPAGLLRSTRPLFWAVLGYDLFLSLLYVRYDEALIRPYHYRVLLPVFVWVLGGLVIGNFINIDLLAQVPVADLLGNQLLLGQLVLAAVIIYIFGTAAYLIQQAVQRVMSQRGEDSATVTSVLIVSRYAVLGIGLLVLASSLGVNTATLAFIGGGLSIGIGFGLQQIIANFISGILLLFEQSLRPGDVIDINGKIGRVEKLNIRSTTVLTNDNIEIIVPNERFLTTEVMSYTRNNQLVRVALPFGVSYSSDVAQVRDVALSAARQHTLVRESPPPQVQFIAFGDSSLDFRLLVWMDQPMQIPRFRSDLYYLLWDAFVAHHIEIPFPQRDLHLRTGWPAAMQE